MANKSQGSAATRTRKGRKTVKQFIKGLPKDLGKVDKIVRLAKKGFSRAEIIAAGFNKNTVHRQVREQVDLA